MMLRRLFGFTEHITPQDEADKTSTATVILERSECERQEARRIREEARKTLLGLAAINPIKDVLRE